MAEYTLTTPTAVALGSSVPYNNTVVDGCCNIRHRSGSGVVVVKGNGCAKYPRRYRASFHANVTGVQGLIQLAMYLDGEILEETLMSVVTVGTSDVNSLSTETEILADCGCQRLSVRVVAGDGVTVNTASIIVDKEAS